MTMTEIDPLTIDTAVALAEVIRWCQTTARLTYLDSRGDVAHGTARCIGDANGNFLGRGEDVRFAYVRITTEMGWEWFVSITEVIDRYKAGTMVAA